MELLSGSLIPKEDLRGLKRAYRADLLRWEKAAAKNPVLETVQLWAYWAVARTGLLVVLSSPVELRSLSSVAV